MNPGELLGLVASCCETVAGHPLTLAREQDIADDLGLSSLQRMEVVHELEQALELEIVGERDLLAVRTVGDLVDVIAALTGPAAPGTAAATAMGAPTSN